MASGSSVKEITEGVKNITLIVLYKVGGFALFHELSPVIKDKLVNLNREK